MSKQYLIVVHGMGQHTEESVKKEVVDAFTTVFSRYESLKAKQVDSMMEIVPVAYNDIIDKYRTERATSGESIGKWLAKINGTQDLLTDAAGEVAGIEASLGKDKFFNTHWLDVLLYRFTFLNERIRLKVAKAVADTITTAQGSANVHVLGHSLGSAVLHDALAKSYGPENFIDDQGMAHNLSSTTHRLASVHMVANVSRALQSFVKVDSSIVRPGQFGCSGVFMEHRHKLDPIAMIRPFNPTNNNGWIPANIWELTYGLVEPSSVTQANVHALGHYLLIPAVHLPMFELLFGFAPKKKERDDAAQEYFKTTVLGKAKVLQSAFGDLRPGDFGSTRSLIEAAKALRDMVEGFGEQF